MKFYRIDIHGHLIEAREGEYGRREVLVDGRPVPWSWWSRFLNRSVHIDLTDEQGRSRHVEVLWVAPTKFLGLTSRVRFSVDGVERAVLEAERGQKGPGVCPACGYSVRGLPVENGEVRCPECGKHASAKLVGAGLERGEGGAP
ncbi:MAG: hypothetical protein IT438_09455 [Phycisphaerales bacterium]|nr:hypothetical protein [Phycisphaerales bacterium]